MKRVKARSFEDARKFVRSLKLKSFNEYRKYCKSGKKPADIPTAPNTVYENKGWISVDDWLGTGVVAYKYKTCLKKKLIALMATFTDVGDLLRLDICWRKRFISSVQRPWAGLVRL